MANLSFALAHSFPELIMAVGALVLLMLGAFGAGKRDWIISEVAIGILGLAFLSILINIDGKAIIWDGAFVDDAFARFMKMLHGRRYPRHSKAGQRYQAAVFCCAALLAQTCLW